MTVWVDFFGELAWRIVKWPTIDPNNGGPSSTFVYRLYGLMCIAVAALVGLELSRLAVFAKVLLSPLSTPSLENITPAVITALLAFALLAGVASSAPILAMLVVRAAVFVGRGLLGLIWYAVSRVVPKVGRFSRVRPANHADLVRSLLVVGSALFIGALAAGTKQDGHEAPRPGSAGGVVGS